MRSFVHVSVSGDLRMCVRVGVSVWCVVCEGVCMYVGECVGEIMPIGNNTARNVDAVFRSQIMDGIYSNNNPQYFPLLSFSVFGFCFCEC